MDNLYILFVFVFGFVIVRKGGASALIIYLCGVSFLYNAVPIISTPYFTVSRLLVLCFAVSVLLKRPDLLRTIREFPLKYIFLLSFVNHLFIGVLDERLTLFNGLYRSIFQFLITFFPLFLGYASVRSFHDIRNIFKAIVYVAFVICIYGIITFLTRVNIYDAIITKAFNLTSTFNFYLHGDRGLRINSLTQSPITFGVMACVYFLFLFSFNSFVHRNRTVYFLSLSLLLFNCFLSNSRSSIFAFIIGAAIFVALNFNLKRKIKVGVYCILAFFILYSFPFIEKKIDSVVDVFITGGESTAGSNISMREGQFFASLTYYKEHPFWGNGFGFFYEDITGRSDEGISGDELYGAESYVFSLMIEEGGIQIIMNLLLFGALYNFFIRKLMISKHFCSLGAAITSVFLVVAISTGTVEIWQFCMPLIGVCIRATQLKSHHSYC